MATEEEKKSRRYFRVAYTAQKKVGGVVTPQNPRGDSKLLALDGELTCFTGDNKFVNKADIERVVIKQSQADSVTIGAIYEFRDEADFDEWNRQPTNLKKA